MGEISDDINDFLYDDESAFRRSVYQLTITYNSYIDSYTTDNNNLKAEGDKRTNSLYNVLPFHYLLSTCIISLVHVHVLNSVRPVATPWTIQPTRLLCPWNFSGKNTGVGCRFLL